LLIIRIFSTITANFPEVNNKTGTWLFEGSEVHVQGLGVDGFSRKSENAFACHSGGSRNPVLRDMQDADTLRYFVRFP